MNDPRWEWRDELQRQLILNVGVLLPVPRHHAPLRLLGFPIGKPNDVPSGVHRPHDCIETQFNEAANIGRDHWDGLAVDASEEGRTIGHGVFHRVMWLMIDCIRSASVSCDKQSLSIGSKAAIVAIARCCCWASVRGGNFFAAAR